MISRQYPFFTTSSPLFVLNNRRACQLPLMRLAFWP